MRDEEVTLWIQDLKRGDERAAQELWDQYFGRLVGVGRRIIRNAQGQHADEEDVALSAFKSLCLRARDNRFPQLNDRDDLWKLLVTIVARKAFKLARKSKSTSTSTEEAFFEEQLAAKEPSADMIVQMDDTVEALLNRLADDRLRAIAVGKLEGKTNQELANEIGRSVSFIERKLQLIRSVWASETDK